jgi:hypothetical protein
MTIKDFLTQHDVSHIEYVDDILFNLIVNQTSYGVDVNTSFTEQGVKLLTTSDFYIEDDILKYNNLNVDINITNML